MLGLFSAAELAMGKLHLETKVIYLCRKYQGSHRDLPHDVLYFNVHYYFPFLLFCIDTDIFASSYSKQCFLR